ncbi:MAG: TusE/DsrC/DsvC family sulfur relay protein [candidate division Zixibacteria bacterium]|nr:TusE/DsrC/DsvC family sulfur relay protein [candidate division Zixibacteria bacterium]MDD5426807.1 TusE/DsrC/DsvC family sulfur relay protein [candidate division Zixibacteria bacterium]
MGIFKFGDKTYTVDTEEFLLDYNEWDENFARGMAPKVGIISGLSEDHWKIIYFIRDTFKKTGKCPLVYETCRMNRLHLEELKKLFPSGYLRGACKLTGITYKEGYLDQSWLEELAEKVTSPAKGKSYEIDGRGFLLNPSEWDEGFAAMKAHEMKMPKLTEKHWEIIHFLRNKFEKNNLVPTVYETCEENGIELDELEKLFPDGYHRGAVKIAGLRVR